MQTLHPFVDNFVFSPDGKTLLATDDGGISSLFDVESELYGLVQFKGKTYKIDSDQALQTFLNDYQTEKNTTTEISISH